MTTSSRPAFDYTLTSLRNGEQCVEIPLVCHQLIKVTASLHCAVLYSQDTIIPAQQCLLQHMCNDYAGHTGQVKNILCNLMCRLGILSTGHLIRINVSPTNGIAFGPAPVKAPLFAVVPAEEVCYNRLKCKTLWNEGKKMQDRLMTKTSDYYYDLPQELIAQTPLERRDSSRLMVLNKKTGAISHHVFTDIIDYLNPGDVLAVNNSRVMPSRLIGKKEGTDGAIEFLLLKQLGNDEWETMVRPGKRAKIGARFVFGDGLLHAEVLEILEGGNRRVKFEYEGNNIFAVLEEVGRMPLPPYITEQLEDGERYQTVYNKVLGSAAAPTAGLHFTKELLQKIQEKGVKIAYLTLHVGLGTFRPVKVDDVTQHHMHSEHYWVSQEAADLINEAKRTGHRVIAVGTTSCRTLESAYIPGKGLRECSDNTDIFIYPGYQWKCIDALITNFHLPESTLIMLVAAFAGYDHIMNAYHEAVKERYRFFSFGDAMFITNETKPQRNTKH